MDVAGSCASGTRWSVGALSDAQQRSEFLGALSVAAAGLASSPATSPDRSAHGPTGCPSGPELPGLACVADCSAILLTMLTLQVADWAPGALVSLDFGAGCALLNAVSDDLAGSPNVDAVAQHEGRLVLRCA